MKYSFIGCLILIIMSSCMSNPLSGAKFACDPDWQAKGESNPCGSNCICTPAQGDTYKGLCICDGKDTFEAVNADALNDITRPDISEEQPYYPPSANKNQIKALEEVNKFRKMVGVSLVNEDEALNMAAQAHAEFIVKNCQNYANSGRSPHQENPSWEGFTGVNPWDRAKRFNYDFKGGMSQVIAFVNNPTLAVQGWMETLYHRLPLIDPTSVEIGYGNAMTGGGTCTYSMYKKADVMNIGMVPSAKDSIVVYPPDKATNIKRSFDGAEWPQPPPPPLGYPSGTIITVQFGKNITFKVTNHKLIEIPKEEGGLEKEVAHVFIGPFADSEHGVAKDPNYQSGTSFYLAMYAHKPLNPTTTYMVIIDMLRGGKELNLKWSFTTGTK